MAPRKTDPDRADEQAAQVAPSTSRIKGATFLGGVWRAADGSLLSDKEAQQAHRAMDAEAAEARARVVRGEA